MYIRKEGVNPLFKRFHYWYKRSEEHWDDHMITSRVRIYVVTLNYSYKLTQIE